MKGQVFWIAKGEDKPLASQFRRPTSAEANGEPPFEAARRARQVISCNRRHLQGGPSQPF
jgi:hypothetical protein